MSNVQGAMSNSRPMKDSGVEWIGEIPQEWNVISHKQIMHKVKEICEHYNGEDIISLSMSGVRIRDLDAGGKMPTTFDGYQYVEPENMLLCLFDIDVTPRCVGIVKNHGVTSPAYSRFIVHNGYLNRYYDYLLRFIDDEKVFVHLAKNLRSSLTESDFGAIKTIVPPFAEQRRIADFLDRRCAEIDGVIEATKKTIEEYKALKQSIITEAVTKGVRGARPMKDSGIEWIGEIPEEWECKPIKYVAKFQPACDTSKLNDESEITYIPMECLKNGYYIKNTALFGALSSSLTPFEEGDIAMAKVTPCFENGNIAIMNNLASEFGMGSSELFVYRPFAANARYILYWLQNDLFKQAACATMTGTGGLKRVSPYFAKNSCIPVPSSVEQREITEYLDEKCVEVDRLIAIKQQLLAELETYKKSVIYEYVTGKRVVI